RWFQENECKKLWLLYALPPNVSVVTLAEFRASIAPGDAIVMIRGIRNDADFEHERAVMKLNRERFGIDTYVYFLAEPGFTEISSSEARRAAEALDFEILSRSVHPMVVSKLLEHTLDVKNIYLAVGKPGSGKSTYLRMLAERDPETFVIETD